MAEWIVWYSSDALETYHIYFDCSRRPIISNNNLEIVTLSAAKKMNLNICHDCNSYFNGNGGRYVIGDIVDDYQ